MGQRVGAVILSVFRVAKRRDALLARFKEKYVLVPVCPEPFGGMPTPRSGEYLCGGRMMSLELEAAPLWSAQVTAVGRNLHQRRVTRAESPPSR